MSYPKSETPHGVMLPRGEAEDTESKNPGVDPELDRLLNSEMVRRGEDVDKATQAALLLDEATAEEELRRRSDELRYGGLKAPDKELDAKEAEAWTRNRISELTTRAVLEVNYGLTRGSTKERMEAAKDILDRAGFARTSDVRGGSSAPVLVLVGAAVQAPPWAQPARTTAPQAQHEAPSSPPPPSTQVVDAGEK